MDVTRFVLVTLLEVVRELTFRLGHVDLCEKCDEAVKEIPPADPSHLEGG